MNPAETITRIRMLLDVRNSTDFKEEAWEAMDEACGLIPELLIGLEEALEELAENGLGDCSKGGKCGGSGWREDYHGNGDVNRRWRCPDCNPKED
jgi:hypothetical protein